MPEFAVLWKRRSFPSSLPTQGFGSKTTETYWKKKGKVTIGQMRIPAPQFPVSVSLKCRRLSEIGRAHV